METNEATAKQLALLHKLGIGYRAGITKKEASDLIEQNIKKKPDAHSSSPPTTTKEIKAPSTPISTKKELGATEKVIKAFEQQRFNELNKFDIDKELEDSIKIVATHLSISPSDSLVFSKWANLIAEIYHSKFAEYMSKEIQKNKLYNIGALK